MERLTGAQVSTRWWEQAGLNLGQGKMGIETDMEEEGEGEEKYTEAE